MIELFKEPKQVTVNEVINAWRDHRFRYVRTFEYGDYDNWVTAIIDTINIPLQFAHKDEQTLQINTCLEVIWKYNSEVEREGYNNSQSITSYEGRTIAINDLAIILELPIDVVGIWKEK